MRERLINRRQQGDLGEVSAIEWLTRQGATVLMPIGHSPDYDLIADFDGRLMRVQVKTSTFLQRTPNGHQRWAVSICTNGGNQSWTGTTKWFDANKVDVVFVVVGDGRRWLIPASDIESTNGLNLGGPKYGQYEIEPAAAITPLVYGGDECVSTIESARGSAGVGEPGRSVKSVTTSEWVRFPPPPSSASPTPLGERARGRSLRYQRTTISTAHQITVPSVPFARRRSESWRSPPRHRRRPGPRDPRTHRAGSGYARAR